MTDDNVITVEARHVFGHIKYYPLCKQAKAFASIANTTTLTEPVVRKIKSLGYSVQVQQTLPTTL